MFFNASGVAHHLYALTMDVTMVIGLGCLRHHFQTNRFFGGLKRKAIHYELEGTK
jgi:hypothetical protein